MSATPIEGVIYTLDPVTQVYRADGRPNLPASDRDALAALYGTYVPSADETGPYAPGAMTSIYVSPSANNSQAGGVASTSSFNGLGGQWIIDGAYGLSPVTINGTTRMMAVLEDLDIHGSVRAEVPVFIRNCKIRNRSGLTDNGNWWAGLSVEHSGAAGSYVVDTEFTVDQLTELRIAGVYGGAGVTCERVNAHGGVDLARVWGGANSFLGSWFHGMQWTTGTYAPQPEGPHEDVIQFAPNVAYTGAQVIRGTFLDATVPGHPINSGNNGPACIMIPGSTTTAFNLSIQQSWLRWGWFPINIGGTPHASSTITMTDVKADPGWYTASGTTYHSVETTAWQPKVSKTNCRDWSTTTLQPGDAGYWTNGGAWRMRGGG